MPRDALTIAIGEALIDRGLPEDAVWHYMDGPGGDDDRLWRILDEIETDITMREDLHFDNETQTYVPDEGSES